MLTGKAPVSSHIYQENNNE